MHAKHMFRNPYPKDGCPEVILLAAFAAKMRLYARVNPFLAQVRFKTKEPPLIGPLHPDTVFHYGISREPYFYSYK